MINLKSIKKVLFLFCHPDDETLGSGGTMSRFSREKKNVYLAFSSLGIDSRHKNNNKALRIQKKRIKEDLDKVLRLYKIKKKNLFSNNFPDNKSDTVPLLEIIKWCENLISKIKPDIIFTHHKGCTNIDHRKLYEAVVVASRAEPKKKIAIISSEILSSTGYLKPANFEPNLFIKLNKKDLTTKIKAMETYSTEKRSYPHPRSSEVLRSLCVLRGSYSGNELAEAFIIENLYI